MPSDDEAGGSFDSGPWQVLDAAPDAIVVVGSDGLMEFANAQTEAVFGYPRAELVGKPLEKLIPDRFRPTHAAHVSRFRANPRTRSMGSGLDLFGRHRDGTDIPVEVSLSSIRSASGTTLICAAIRDVTERRRIESAAKLNASRLASAVETIEDAFALFDSAGPAVGQSYEELVDVWMNDLAFESAEDRARFREERLAGRSDPKGAFEVRTRDGRTLRVMDRRTVEGGIVKTIWDLTEDKRAAADLREARTAAETASAAKSEFLSSMSH